MEILKKKIEENGPMLGRGKARGLNNMVCSMVEKPGFLFCFEWRLL